LGEFYKFVEARIEKHQIVALSPHNGNSGYEVLRQKKWPIFGKSSYS